MSHSAPTFLGPRIAAVGFLALTAAFGLNFAAGQFFAPLTEQQGWALGTTSAAAALNTAVAGVTMPPLGRLIDRRGPRLVGAAYVLLATVDETWQFVLVYGLLAGVGFAGSGSLAVTVLMSRWYVRRRTAVLRRVFLGINAGQLTLVPLAGLLIEQAGFRAAYLVLGLVVLALVVPLVALLSIDSPERAGQFPDGLDRPTAEATGITTVAAAVRSRPFWLLTLAFGVNGWTLYFTLLHLPRLARDFGAGASAAGGLLALAAAASAVAIVGTAPLVDRCGKRRVVIGLFALRAAVLVGAAALATRPEHLAPVALLFGVASFPVIPLVMALIGERFGTSVLGGVLGLVYVSHQLFAGLGVLAGGLLRSATSSFDSALALCALALVLGIALLRRVDDLDLPRPANPIQKGTP
jgi:MFS family permease